MSQQWLKAAMSALLSLVLEKSLLLRKRGDSNRGPALKVTD